MTRIIRSLTLLGITAAAASSLAGTGILDVYVPKNSTFITASTYRPETLISNVVINGARYSGTTYNTQVSRFDFGTYFMYRVRILDIPAGFEYFSNVRNNSTGAMRSTGRVRLINWTDTIYIGNVSFL
jgi:hypothetical protein